MRINIYASFLVNNFYKINLLFFCHYTKLQGRFPRREVLIELCYARLVIDPPGHSFTVPSKPSVVTGSELLEQPPIQSVVGENDNGTRRIIDKTCFIGQALGKCRHSGRAKLAGDARLLKFQQAAVYRLKTSGKSFGCRSREVSTHRNKCFHNRDANLYCDRGSEY